MSTNASTQQNAPLWTPYPPVSQRWYAVINGVIPDVYQGWHTAAPHVVGYSGFICKRFRTEAAARQAFEVGRAGLLAAAAAQAQFDADNATTAQLSSSDASMAQVNGVGQGVVAAPAVPADAPALVEAEDVAAVSDSSITGITGLDPLTPTALPSLVYGSSAHVYNEFPPDPESDEDIARVYSAARAANAEGPESYDPTHDPSTDVESLDALEPAQWAGWHQFVRFSADVDHFLRCAVDAALASFPPDDENRVTRNAFVSQTAAFLADILMEGHAYYALARSHRNPSIYRTNWVNVQPLLEGHPDPLWNAFRTRAAAHEWLTNIVQNMEGYGAFMAARAESPTGPSD